MSAQDKTLGLLLDLGNPAARRTRSGQIEQALRTALVLTDADAAMALIPGHRRGERLALYAGTGASALVPAAEGGSVVMRALTDDTQPLLVADLSEEARLAEGDRCPGVDAGPAMFVPLRLRDPVPGYLAVYRRRGRARFTVADRNVMLMLSSWLAISLDSLRLSSGAQKLAMTDDLTEVYNARFLKAALRREVRRAGRFAQELSLVLVDVDGLEAAQEAHGEPKAGLLLREVATLLAQQVRSFDLLARRAAGEFVLILPQTARPGALEVAERVRASVERATFSIGPAGSVTVSCGVAVFPREGADETALIATVERALSHARERGPNRVESLDRRAA